MAEFLQSFVFTHGLEGWRRGGGGGGGGGGSVGTVYYCCSYKRVGFNFK